MQHLHTQPPCCRPAWWLACLVAGPACLP